MKHRLIAAICFASLVAGFFLARLLNDCSHAARAGAIVVAVAVLCEGWLLLRTTRSDDMPFWGSPESHKAGRVAIALIVLGTLTQGYGDLLARNCLQICR